MISTYFTPPNSLPRLTLIIKDAKLVMLDWDQTKSAQLFDKLGRTAHKLAPSELDDQDPNHKIAQQAIQELTGYFLGTHRHFDTPLDLSLGTDFEQRVWQALQDIPYGQTISYKALAQRIGKPTAFRACANANGKNPISLIIPCHRVIAADGGLGGYTGGLNIKRSLLTLEQTYR